MLIGCVQCVQREKEDIKQVLEEAKDKIYMSGVGDKRRVNKIGGSIWVSSLTEKQFILSST